MTADRLKFEAEMKDKAEERKEEAKQQFVMQEDKYKQERLLADQKSDQLIKNQIKAQNRELAIKERKYKQEMEERDKDIAAK